MLIANDFKPILGGVAEYTHRLAEQLGLFSDTVQVFAPAIKGCSSFDGSVGYSVVRCPAPHSMPRLLPGIVRQWRRASAISGAISQFEPHVCVFNHTSADYFAGYIACRLRRTPMVLCTHGNELKLPRSRRKWLQLKWVLGHLDGIVCNSEYTCGLVQELVSFPVRTCCVHPGIEDYDGPLEAPRLECLWGLRLNSKPWVPLIVSICRHIDRKGLDKALGAFREVLREIPNCVYVIAGVGPGTSRLKRLVRHFGLQKSVFFAGRVSEAEKHALLNVASCFLMPNRELPNGDVEGFGIVFLEAAIHSVPAVAGATGGVPEAVLNGKTGLIVNPTDERVIAKAILKLLKDPLFRKELGENARERALEELSWQKQALKLRDFLSELLFNGETTNTKQFTRGQR